MIQLYEKEIQDSIISIVESSIKENSFIGFYSLLKELSNKYVFSIEDVDGVLSVKGEDGFRKICTIYHLLKEMEEKKIIFFVKNDVNCTSKYTILNNKAEIEGSNSNKITGDLKTFLLDNIQVNIWPSLDFEWFKSNGFLSKELYEAKQQTHKAHKTLIISVLALIVSILTIFVSNINQLVTCPVLILIISISIIVLILLL